jgi:hypothetical protein
MIANDVVGGHFLSQWAARNGGTRPLGGLPFDAEKKTRPEAAFHLRRLNRSGVRLAMTNQAWFERATTQI